MDTETQQMMDAMDAAARPRTERIIRSRDQFIVSVIERTDSGPFTHCTCIATLEQVELLKEAAGHHTDLQVVAQSPCAVGTALQWMAGRPRPKEVGPDCLCVAAVEGGGMLVSACCPLHGRSDEIDESVLARVRRAREARAGRGGQPGYTGFSDRRTP